MLPHPATTHEVDPEFRAAARETRARIAAYRPA
jgi:hypothetical protein